MTDFDTTFPPLLATLMTMEFDYDDGDGIDFEPYAAFSPADENKSWLRAWTGNKEVDGADLRVFGQDGTGGYAAFWLVNEGKALVDQPIVFYGSEGERGVVAVDLADFLWLLAGGVGPKEAVEYGGGTGKPNEAFAAFAAEHASARKKSAAEVVAAAKAAHPGFEAHVSAMCG